MDDCKTDDKNPILAAAQNLFELLSEKSLDDPEAAYREFVNGMVWVVIDQHKTATLDQLRAIQSLSGFHDKSLVQVRKAVASGDLRVGPHPGNLASKFLIPMLRSTGLTVDIQALSENETKELLKDFENLPEYLRRERPPG